MPYGDVFLGLLIDGTEWCGRFDLCGSLLAFNRFGEGFCYFCCVFILLLSVAYDVISWSILAVAYDLILGCPHVCHSDLG